MIMALVANAVCGQCDGCAYRQHCCQFKCVHYWVVYIVKSAMYATTIRAMDKDLGLSLRHTQTNELISTCSCSDSLTWREHKELRASISHAHNGWSSALLQDVSKRHNTSNHSKPKATHCKSRHEGSQHSASQGAKDKHSHTQILN